MLTIRNEELLYLKDILCSRPNVYYDTSGLKNQLFAIEKITDALGSKNLLYGSLHPLFCLKSTQLLVSKSVIGDQAKKDIFFENARGLFEL
jgi:predicted TIM-barrel fold metal-dependent hydrolase